MKRAFSRGEIREICGRNFPWGVKLTKLHDTSRWGNIYEVVFEFENKFWRTYFEVGSGDSDWNYWDDYNDIECVEVVPMQVVVTEWFNVE